MGLHTRVCSERSERKGMDVGSWRAGKRNAKGRALLDSKHMEHPEIIDWKCQQGERKNSPARSKQKGKGERDRERDTKLGLIKKDCGNKK